MEGAEPEMPSSSNSTDDRRRSFVDVASASQVHEEEEEEEEEDENEDEQEVHQDLRRGPVLERQRISISYNEHVNTGLNGESYSVIGDDTWSCVVVVLTFWFFVSMTLVLGVYGSINVKVGPNCSLLLQPNSIFVRNMKVEELDDSKPGMMLYGFHETPPLDVVKTWSQVHSVSLPTYSHKEWIYFLNKGSEVNISYRVNSFSNSSVVLVIAQGNEGFIQWLEDPAYPNTTLSWNMVHGRGTIQQEILKSSSYYVAVANLNSEVVEVELNLSVMALLYNTTKASYKCHLSFGICNLKLSFPKGNVAVLTSPGPNPGAPSEEMSVRLSYGSRWLTYIVGIGGMTVLMSLAFSFLNKFQCTREDGARAQYGGMGSERTPLLSHKDDDLLSWGSSYESLSQDEEEPEVWMQGRSLKDGENYNNHRRLCVICFDAPRDCFFLPCGHCMACFSCGTRIAEEAATCPICRRNTKKVRKIFTV